MSRLFGITISLVLNGELSPSERPSSRDFPGRSQANIFSEAGQTGSVRNVQRNCVYFFNKTLSSPSFISVFSLIPPSQAFEYRSAGAPSFSDELITAHGEFPSNSQRNLLLSFLINVITKNRVFLCYKNKFSNQTSKTET